MHIAHGPLYTYDSFNISNVERKLLCLLQDVQSNLAIPDAKKLNDE